MSLFMFKTFFPPDVTTDEWAFHLLPLDDDIISLELPEFFRDYFLVLILSRWKKNVCCHVFCNSLYLLIS